MIEQLDVTLEDLVSIKCSVYCGASLDGFIAREDGDISWLHHPAYSTAETVGLTYKAFVASVDTIVMGRNTFEKVLTFKEWPYELPVVVLSTTVHAPPDHLLGHVRVLATSPSDTVEQLESEGRQHLYIDGGITIQQFLQARLIHELTVTFLPVMPGGGIPLFGSTGVESQLRLIGAASASNGLVQVRYAVEGAAQHGAAADRQPATRAAGR